MIRASLSFATLVALAGPSAARLFDPAKPSFGFACTPASANLPGPSFEYRIFLPTQRIPSTGPARVEVTRLTGVAGYPKRLDLNNGTLSYTSALANPDGSRVTMFLVLAHDAAKTPHAQLDMTFGIKAEQSASGQITQTIGKSTGTLFRKSGGKSTTFKLECESIRERPLA